MILTILWALQVGIAVFCFGRWDELCKKTPGFVFSNSAGLMPGIIGLSFFPGLGMVTSVAGALYIENEYKGKYK